MKSDMVPVAKPTIREKLVAEFVGTFMLVLTVGISVVGGGSMAALAIGLVLGIQIYTFASISGGHFNPAVTLAILLSGRGKIKPVQASLYMATQFVAAVTGGLIAFWASSDSFCFDHILTRGGWGGSFVLEVLFTSVLCSIVLAAGTSWDAPNHYYGFAIGLAVTGVAFASGGFNQSSLNPAVTFGIDVANYFNGHAKHHPSLRAWFLFLVAPYLGGALSAGIFRIVRRDEVKFTEESSDDEGSSV